MKEDSKARVLLHESTEVIKQLRREYSTSSRCGFISLVRAIFKKEGTKFGTKVTKGYYPPQIKILRNIQQVAFSQGYLKACRDMQK